MDKEQIIQLRNHHLKQGRNNDRRPIYPITKAECIIGGAGVTQVTELPATGDEGKIYYNTTEKVYYTYTEENGWSELGSGSDSGGLKQYVFPYQGTPCFFDARTPVGPAGLDDYIEYDQEHDLFLIKDGVELTMANRRNVNEAAEALSQYYTSMMANINYCSNRLVRDTTNGPESSFTISKTIDVLDLYSRDLAAHSDDSWNRGRAWEFIIYTVEVNIEYDASDMSIFESFKILNKKIGSIGEYIFPHLNIVYTALRQNGLFQSDTGTKGYITGIRHIGDVLQGYNNGMASGIQPPSKIARIDIGVSRFTDYDTGIKRLQITDGNSISTRLPLFCNLRYSGRFIANVTNMLITLPNTIFPAESNPSTEEGHRYEFSIFDGIFTLADVSTTTN